MEVLLFQYIGGENKMNEEYWRLIQLKKSLEILKEQENGTITRTEIDDMNRNIQITKLCYNDGYNEGFQKGKLKQKKEELEFLRKWLNGDGALADILKRIKQLKKEIGEEKQDDE